MDWMKRNSWITLLDWTIQLSQIFSYLCTSHKISPWKWLATSNLIWKSMEVQQDNLSAHTPSWPGIFSHTNFALTLHMPLCWNNLEKELFVSIHYEVYMEKVVFMLCFLVFPHGWARRRRLWQEVQAPPGKNQHYRLFWHSRLLTTFSYNKKKVVSLLLISSL